MNSSANIVSLYNHKECWNDSVSKTDSFTSSKLCNSYTMCYLPVRGDNPRASASGLSYVRVDNPWYN